jgi:hypothetical protein
MRVERIAADVRRPAARRADGASARPSPSLLLNLQRRIGNHAVAALVQRQANVTAEFIGKTPEQNAVIAAAGEYALTSEAFEVEAEFKPAREGSAEEQKQMVNSGQYRQFVRGHFTGPDEPHTLVGDNPGPLDREVWREDVLPGARFGKKRYGYRVAGGQAPQGFYLDRERKAPDREFGPFFWCWDQPSGSSKDSEMNLEFEGRLVDVNDSSRVVATRHWRVAGKKGV